MDVVSKEIYNLKFSLDVLEDGFKIPVGQNKNSGHLVFDVRMMLEWKARWFKDTHMTHEPEQSTFDGFVSRESTRTALTHALLNDLHICACAIYNTCLQSLS